MKKISVILLIVAFLLVPLISMAAPFAVSDPANPADEVTTFKIFMDGALLAQAPVVDGAVRYDLAGIPTGAHTLTAQFCNIWACSGDSGPLAINKKIPGAPVLRIGF